MDEIEGLLLELKHEIEGLRRRNELLQARVDTMDLVARLVGGVQRSQGEGIDPMWRVDQFLEARRVAAQEREQREKEEQALEKEKREEEVKAFLAGEKALERAGPLVPRREPDLKTEDRPLRQRVGHVDVDNRKVSGA